MKYLAAPSTHISIEVQVTSKTWFPFSRFPFQHKKFSVPLFQPRSKVSLAETALEIAFEVSLSSIPQTATFRLLHAST